MCSSSANSIVSPHSSANSIVSSRVVDMMRSSPTSVSPQNLPNGHHPQNITNGHHFTPANELCAINGRATPPSIEKNLGSLVTHSANVPLQPVDLDALTKTLKKDCKLTLHIVDLFLVCRSG